MIISYQRFVSFLNKQQGNEKSELREGLCENDSGGEPTLVRIPDSRAGKHCRREISDTTVPMIHRVPYNIGI